MAPPVPSLSPRARDMPVPRNHSCILARVPSPLLLGARSWEAARSRVPKGRAGQAAGCRQVNTTRGWGQRWGARPPDQLQQLRPPGPCYDARVHPGVASKWASQEAGVPCGPHRGGPPPPGSLCPGLQLPLFVEHFRTLGREGQETVGGPLPAAVRYKVGCETQRGRGGARHAAHPSRKEAGQAQPEERAQEGTPGGAVPRTGGHCPAVLGPPEAATASRKSHPRPVPGVQWKGWGHHDKPRAGPREPRGASGPSLSPPGPGGGGPCLGGSREPARWQEASTWSR